MSQHQFWPSQLSRPSLLGLGRGKPKDPVLARRLPVLGRGKPKDPKIHSVLRAQTAFRCLGADQCNIPHGGAYSDSHRYFILPCGHYSCLSWRWLSRPLRGRRRQQRERALHLLHSGRVQQVRPGLGYGRWLLLAGGLQTVHLLEPCAGFWSASEPSHLWLCDMGGDAWPILPTKCVGGLLGGLLRAPGGLLGGLLRPPGGLPSGSLLQALGGWRSLAGT